MGQERKVPCSLVRTGNLFISYRYNKKGRYSLLVRTVKLKIKSQYPSVPFQGWNISLAGGCGFVY
jgi:hypothetical protein